MFYILLTLTVLAFLFVLFTLVMGAKSMGGNSDASREASKIWMRRRVSGQVVAIGLLFLTFYMKSKGAG